MSIEEIIQFLEHEGAEWDSRGQTQIKHDFEIKPQDFLSYAEKDLASEYEHNLINSLSNAKRALDCQIDILLIAFGFYTTSNKKTWGFPKKLDLIKELGIIAPRVLLKINKTRNLMEHHFAKPNLEQVEDFVDIVALFIASTDKYIYNFADSLDVNSPINETVWLSIKNRYSENLILIDINSHDKVETIRVLSSDEKYIALLKSVLTIANKN